MGKYSLGKATTKINSKMSKDSLNLDESKATPLKNSMMKQFDTIQKSLTNINSYMNKAVSKKVVTGSYANAFKGWAKKCNSQSAAAKKRRTALNTKYSEDVRNYTVKLLDQRIAELEAKINALGNDSEEDIQIQA